MNYNDFVNKYKGRFLDYDHAFGNQCVDLMRGFVKEVYGVNPYVAIPQTGYAKNIFYNFKDNAYFKKVLNGPSNSPKKGDIVFWGTYPFITGIAGHVVLCDVADANNLIVFSQNYPTSSPCIFRKFNYRGVLGWLTHK